MSNWLQTRLLKNNPPPPLPPPRCPHCRSVEPPHNWTKHTLTFSKQHLNISITHPQLSATCQLTSCNVKHVPSIVSPRVHLQPGVQLSGFGSVHSRQDVPAVHVDDLHGQVAHLTRLIQRLQERRGGTDDSFHRCLILILMFCFFLGS